VGGCECSDLIPPGSCSRVSSDGDCNCSSKESTKGVDEQVVSCSDCSLSFVVELDDFVGADSLQPPSQSSSDFHSSIEWDGEKNPALTLRNSIHGIRGSPPLVGLISSVSLQVRYSVFLV